MQQYAIMQLASPGKQINYGHCITVIQAFCRHIHDKWNPQKTDLRTSQHFYFGISSQFSLL